VVWIDDLVADCETHANYLLRFLLIEAIQAKRACCART